MSKSRNARGSVLVFAVVLLVLLVGVGVAFVLFVRQEFQATSNALRNVQLDWAAESGLQHALYRIRDDLLKYRLVSPDGSFVYPHKDPATPYLDKDGGYLRFFERFEDYDETAKAPLYGGAPSPVPFAVLSYWETTPPSPLPLPKETPYFVEAPLTISTAPDGARRASRANGTWHCGLACQFTVTDDLGAFYSTGRWPQTLPRIPGERGEYYVWVADLDSKLYIVPSEWNKNMPAGDRQGLLTDSSRSAPLLINSKPEELLAQAEVDWLLKASNPSAPQRSIGDMALWLRDKAPGGKLDPAGEADVYLPARCALDRFLTPYKDVAPALDAAPLYRADPATTPLPFVKETETALNVNTTTPEMLTAILARVPQLGDARAPALAKRICAKRPFLCRMDFEDFLAAHLNENPDTDPDNHEEAPPLKPAALVYAALDRRLDPPQFTLCEFLELDIYGLNDDAVLAARSPEWKDAKAHTRDEMKKRFEFFRADDAAAPLKDALLSPRMFNNLLNCINDKRRERLIAAADPAQDTLTCPGHGLRAPLVGETPPIVKLNVKSGGVLPDPLQPNTIYYANVVSPEQLQLCASEIDCRENRPVDLLSAGSGSFYLYTYGFSFYSQDVVRVKEEDAEGNPSYRNEIVNLPFLYSPPEPPAVTGQKIRPKLEYQELGSVSDVVEQSNLELLPPDQRKYTVKPGTGTPGQGELTAWRATRASAFCEMAFSSCPDLQQKIYAGSFTRPVFPGEPPLVFVEAPALTLGTPNGPGDSPTTYNEKAVIVDGTTGYDGDGICSTTVHGPLRAYKNAKDTPPITDALSEDAAWTPRFAYRSRFYKVYVLSRTVMGFDDMGGSIYGAKRIEANYDALLDRVLWRRYQVTELRALGDPR